MAGSVMAWGLSPRSGTYVVGFDAEEAARWSAGLSASVIVVPRANQVLTEILHDELATTSRATVVQVNSSGGGTGVSTLASGLAWAAARSGIKVGLVELNPSAGGIDLLLGIERKDGWRWPELASARGVTTDLGSHVPSLDGVEVVSAGRVGVHVPPAARRAVVDSLAGDHDLVVVDPGGLDTPEVTVNVKVGVVAADLRSVMTARGQNLPDLLVARRGPGRSMPDEDIESVLGVRPDMTIKDDRRLARGQGDWTPMDVAHAILDCGRVASDKTVLAVVEELRRTSTGAGRLDPLLAMDGVTDVLVNGPNQVFIDRGQGLELTDVTFSGPEEVRALAVRLAAAVGRRLDDGNPWVDARLPDGTRVHAVLDVLARPGTCLSLRVPSRRCLSLDDWVTGGSMAPGCRRMIDTILSRKLAFLVTGGTGTGKTTLLSAMLTSLPSDQRLVIVEDSREIWIDHPHWVSMEARAANSEGKGSVTLTDLVRQCLRMRPDRIVLGEVRGAELRDLLMALNTGHEGGCGTVHANGVAEVPARLEALAALGGLSREAASAQITAALHTVIHVERGERGRRVAEIGVFVDVEGRAVVLPAVRWDADGVMTLGDGAGRLSQLLGMEVAR